MLEFGKNDNPSQNQNHNQNHTQGASTQIIAIDLGTTNSLVGVYQDGQSVLIKNAYDKYTTPSAIALDVKGQVLIGNAALELRHQGMPVLTSFKRLMGTDKKLSLGNKAFNAVELSSLILQSLKQDAEQYLGHSVSDAIITVPAYFNDIQRQATIKAAQLAGLNVSRLINEPTAAALAYGLGQSDDSCFLVFDLGGGTFDVSIVELFDGVIEVRASAGDNHLGGDDFIATIVKQFWMKYADQFGQNANQSPIPALEMLLTAKAQHVLHQFSTQESVNMLVQWQQQEYAFEFNRTQFATWIEPLLQRLKKPLERAMRDARIRPDDIDQIVMVGGATRILAVRQMVTKLFGRFPSTAIQPDEAIVRGACVQAGLKAKDACLKEVVLTDVCPFSLGIETGENNQFDPIIERNTVIPTSKVREYFPR
ncbi:MULTISPECIES: Hsp70 family protein [unclassified Acinetobacter]|uniref:Hsp70 family protein n=1 Tax=unclassified Acinetobacter TaxID=196816 RepID=UPI0035B861D9